MYIHFHKFNNLAVNVLEKIMSIKQYLFSALDTWKMDHHFYIVLES